MGEKHIEELFNKMGLDYNSIYDKYGQSIAWEDMIKEIAVLLNDDKIKASPHYLVIQNYSKLLGKYILADSTDYQITQVEENVRTYDIEGLYNSQMFKIYIERSFDEGWNGYLITFEAGLIKDRRHVSKKSLASPSDFTTLIETFITNNLISLPF
jgi:hypothetical protein